MAKQLTLFDCADQADQANKRRRVNDYEESDICDDPVVCESELVRDDDDDAAADSTANLTSTTQGTGEEEQMIDHDSIDDSTDFCVHGNDGSPSSVHNDIIEINHEPAMVSNTPGSSCSDATLVLHGQHEGNNAPSVGPIDIAQSPAFPPVQPVNIQFPKTAFGNRTRSFNPGWYGSYEWLDYSVRLNACFCYPCRLFGSHCSQFSSRPEPAFTVNGFKNWKHATGTKGILSGHANC